MTVGVERFGFYGGVACVDVGRLAQARGLDPQRFNNLLMRRKSLHLPFEDPVSFAVNAAKPLVDALTAAERESIGLLIVASESGIDWGKSITSYVHPHLGLSRRCRMFEVKQACFGGAAAFMSAVGAVSSGQVRRALVIATDLARCVPHSYAEPAQGSAAVALLIGPEAEILALEPGASGSYGYEVMDSCRPTADIETGDVDLSLLSYLDCLEHSFLAYRDKVGPIDFQEHFAYLAWHTPFGGMVKGGHRTLMRKLKPGPPAAIEADFEKRLRPSLTFCQEVGNIYSGTMFLALAGVLARGDFAQPRRIGLFAYGSGCCSEFFSGMATKVGAARIEALDIDGALAGRLEMSIADYDLLLTRSVNSYVGQRDMTIDPGPFEPLLRSRLAGRLVLDSIAGYQRRYRWA
ncbi:MULTISPECIES: hydroxymethylglutaryl-CoA synthase family protein [Methylosinus]|uniref:3-hydroxy-3-methylglutaryl-ACP synthase n=1 Tax=Methylosinus trichosporium (strain ATCC 35070 / NCIMB 11131 / UNIQEM 75 / OB3b) TaxID=595536 RepID=A0A2D2D6E4_METT3|nr:MULTISPECIES: hydroxymethylglutaryl-CoA synthase [Methylosinus]ATQ70577.1 3-hydroxy-3-methylglutaryl-ACP synthase [Methylosinus trichosporium OB3b]OBS51066.1 3-hydroxy-3-methylglutaryl-ACP synthase [Methylosinus sp. 3S-1]